MLLTHDEILGRASELQKLNFVLAEDPVLGGLTGISKQLANIQYLKDKVSRMLLEAINNRSQAQVIFDTKKAGYEADLRRLLTTDTDVQGQKTEALRTAMACTKIPTVVLDVTHAENDLTAADAYYKMAHQMYANLESVNSNLSRQISVIEMGLKIGEVNKEDLKSLFTGREINI